MVLLLIHVVFVHIMITINQIHEILGQKFLKFFFIYLIWGHNFAYQEN